MTSFYAYFVIFTFMISLTHGAVRHVSDTNSIETIKSAIDSIFANITIQNTRRPYDQCNTFSILLRRIHAGQTEFQGGLEGTLNSCPWFFRVHRDDNRYPQNISQAELKSCFNVQRPYCVDLTSVASGRLRSNKFGVCRKVEQTLPVLRKDASEYNLDTETVVTGYTCDYNIFERLPVISNRRKRGALSRLLNSI